LWLVAALCVASCHGQGEVATEAGAVPTSAAPPLATNVMTVPLAAAAAAAAASPDLASNLTLTTTADCKHGVRDPHTLLCKCYDDWATAGITDTLNFLEGVCSQFECRTDQHCQQVLGFSDATCPVRGWNCFCGLGKAFEKLGHGYESTDRGGAECMGVMYYFSVQTTWMLMLAMKTLWKGFVVLAVLALPFGRKRTVCDHHWPSLWHWLRMCFGCRPTCHGGCLNRESYCFEMFLDDIAWSVYILDIGVWVYIFAATLYLICMLIWSIILWTIVVIMLIVAVIAGCCMLCGDASSSGGGGDCCNCCEGDIGHCCGGDCDCCPIGGDTGLMGPGLGATDQFYLGGAVPYDPIFGYYYWGGYGGGGGDCCCSCECCDRRVCNTVCCKPLALLLYIFPTMPENAWGGLMGWLCFGTHNLTPTNRLYQGGNQLVDTFGMRWMRTADLHASESWRTQVHNFIANEPVDPPPASEVIRVSSSRLRETEYVMHERGRKKVVKVGRARAIVIQRAFEQEEDRCVEASWQDYENKECWICRGTDPEWDMWLTCRHLFCKKCSTEMLTRNMPCPLCRVASTTVLRGLEEDADDETSHSKSGEE